MFPTRFENLASVSAQALLEQYAPIALRGLYERDARQSFCQAALWTAPFKNWETTQQQQQQHGGLEQTRSVGTTSGNTQNRSSGGGSNIGNGRWSSRGGFGRSSSSSGSGSADTTTAATTSSSSSSSSSLPFVAAVIQALVNGPNDAPATAEGAGVASKGRAAAVAVRPASLVGLLRAAPQAIPFEVRLDLFRQMLLEDKVGGHRSVSNLAPVFWLMVLGSLNQVLRELFQPAQQANKSFQVRVSLLREMAPDNRIGMASLQLSIGKSFYDRHLS